MAAAASLSIQSRAPRRVLVVDDDADVREAIQTQLTDAGYSVRTAADGRAALTMLLRDDRPDLILLDLAMPEVNGYQVLERLRESTLLVNVPVVVISAHLGFPPAGAMAWLKKPFAPDKLLSVVQTFLP